jgi:hypothetical protein
MPYALFDRDRRIGAFAATELDAWRAALQAGLISDLPVADEQGGQILPRGSGWTKILSRRWSESPCAIS